MVYCEHSIKATYYSISVQIIIKSGVNVAKFYRLGGLTFTPHIFESGKSETTVVQSDSGKDIFPWFSQFEERGLSHSSIVTNSTMTAHSHDLISR